MKTPGSALGGLFGVACAAALATLFLIPAGAVASTPAAQGGWNQTLAASSTTEVDMANDGCHIYVSPTACHGGYGANQTFRSNLQHGEIVTVTLAYLYGNSEAVAFSLNDTLGNTISLVSSQCSISTPIICSAVGFFRVTSPGQDDIYFTEIGGSTGVMWYNAEIWQGQFGRLQFASGTSSYCASNCTSQLGLGPVSSTGTTGAIALSAYAAVYTYTPATWQPSYPYYYSMTDCAGLGYQCQGGDSILWQAITSLSPSYDFGATTSPTPVVWSGSAEVISW